MSSQKVGSIKVPPFDKENYNLWKKKMSLFIKAANPLYMGLLSNGPFVPSRVVEKHIDANGVRIPEQVISKELSEYTPTDSELVALDTPLQLIIVDSIDPTMNQQIISCVSGKQMWDTIVLIMEGIDEVRENRLDILTSQYEAFKSSTGENISSVFERYNKILNELSIQGKSYLLRETNKKFMLTLPHHVEYKASSIQERVYFSTMSLENLYGKLKMHEMEQEQWAIIYGSGTVDSQITALLKTTTLVAHEPVIPEAKVVEAPNAGPFEILEA